MGTYPTYLPSQRTDRRTEAKIPDTKFIDLSFAAFQKLDSFESDLIVKIATKVGTC